MEVDFGENPVSIRVLVVDLNALRFSLAEIPHLVIFLVSLILYAKSQKQR